MAALDSLPSSKLPAGKPVFPEESYRIVGACFQVYNELGSGFLEAVYQEALCLELKDTHVPFLAQQELQVRYKSHVLKTTYRPDVICFGKIIVEIKAIKELANDHRAQVHNYLKATGYRLGILVNFGQHPDLVFERVVR